jgi:hypothetical protein
MQFNSQDGSVIVSVVYPVESNQNGKSKMVFQRNNYSSSYTLSKARLAIGLTQYRLTFAAISQGIAGYASYVSLVQGEGAPLCKISGTLFHQ